MTFFVSGITGHVGGATARHLLQQGHAVRALVPHPQKAAGWRGKKIIELGSPVSPDDLARAMSEVLGLQVKAQAIPRAQWTNTFESFGMSPGTTGAYEEMLDGLNSGWIDFGLPGTEAVAGTTTPTEVFKQASKAAG